MKRLAFVGLVLLGLVQGGLVQGGLVQADEAPKLDPADAIRIAIPTYEARISRLLADLLAERAKHAAPAVAQDLRRQERELRAIETGLRAVIEREVAAAAAKGRLDPARWRPDIGALIWRDLFAAEKP